MPIEIDFGEIPGGYSAVDAGKGEAIPIILREFTSSEDGSIFVSRLDGLPSVVLSKLPEGSRIPRSCVDHLLVIFRKDKTATVYLNELPIQIRMRSREAVGAGTLVTNSQIAEITKLRFPADVDIPNDAGILFVFSVGWRKGLYFDLLPLIDAPRDYDFECLLGGYYSYLTFQNLFSVADEQWETMFRLGWFPFVGLSDEIVSKICWSARRMQEADDLVDAAANDFEVKSNEFLARWRLLKAAAPHIEFLETAVNHFLKGEHMAACSIIYPRIEGLMRTFHKLQNLSTNSAKQINLSAAAIDQYQSSAH